MKYFKVACDNYMSLLETFWYIQFTLTVSCIFCRVTYGFIGVFFSGFASTKVNVQRIICNLNYRHFYRQISALKLMQLLSQLVILYFDSPIGVLCLIKVASKLYEFQIMFVFTAVVCHHLFYLYTRIIVIVLRGNWTRYFQPIFFLQIMTNSQ